VFDRTGTNRTGGRVLDAPTFYFVAIISTVLALAVLALVPHFSRGLMGMMGNDPDQKPPPR
jgi:hypothetical protein